MTKETKQIQGEIQNIRKDFKAIQLLGNWYSSFYVIDDFSKGDYVKIQYTENTKNGKTFYNIQNIELVKQETKETIKEKSPQTPDTTINTMLLCIKEIHLYNNKPLKQIANEVLECYNLIKQST